MLSNSVPPRSSKIQHLCSVFGLDLFPSNTCPEPKLQAFSIFFSSSITIPYKYTDKEMGSLLSSPKTKEQMEAALNKVKDIVSSSPVVVFRYLFFSDLTYPLFYILQVTRFIHEILITCLKCIQILEFGFRSKSALKVRT